MIKSAKRDRAATSQHISLCAMRLTAEHGLDGGDLDAVLWDTPVRFYRLEDRFSRS